MIDFELEFQYAEEQAPALRLTKGSFGLENHGMPQEKIQRRVDEAFQLFHMEHLKDRNVYELSSGERQLSIVRAIMGGYLPYIVLFILSGIIAELLLWKTGYGNAKTLTVSYVINQVFAAFGSTIIPYAIAAKSMADQMVSDGRQDNILAASEFLQSWVSAALVAGVIVASFVGASIGRRIVKKHLTA